MGVTTFPTTPTTKGFFICRLGANFSLLFCFIRYGESVADKKKVNWIAVCSDQKVKDLNKDDFQVLVKDLGIRARTDIKEITAWLKKKKVGKNIIFTTYDSGPNL